MSAYTLFLFYHHSRGSIDSETSSNDECISAPGADDPVFTSSGGGIFAGSQHFVVTGGTFNNSTNNYVTPPAALPDFRMISMGDIDLQKELMVNKESSAIGRRRERNCVRRVYSGKIDGRKSNLTVGVYQGHGAEEVSRVRFLIYDLRPRCRRTGNETPKCIHLFDESCPISVAGCC
ncbi:hypothetical protein B0H16DRAFT_663801 [Mycena metata]|uniref:Uncharacterized protein n=1 Tax=Mycena metata TaxID=1033252 RepID=A0AAD7GYN2_9AGAR|nr:hypothetical protein B0H16DRAFT_663801 [Mycena metata]